MNAVEFVSVIETVVRDASVVDCISIVRNPPGRRPTPKLIELSEWYDRLDEGDRAMVKRMLEMVAEHAVFGLLCVLDGVRQGEHAERSKGYFELRFIKDDTQEILSGPSGKILHELLK
jgi:hypothetical protein